MVLLRDGLPNGVTIGFEGEQFARPMVLNITSFMQRWPDCIPTLIYCRPGETVAYPATTTIEDTKLTWVPDSFVTEKRGNTGSIQLVFTKSGENTVIGKSRVIPMAVYYSLQPSETPPEPYESWINQLLTVGGVAQEFANESHYYADQSHRYADLSEYYAEQAGQDAAKAGFMDVEIDENDHLIYSRTDTLYGVDFKIEDGRLIVQWL